MEERNPNVKEERVPLIGMRIGLLFLVFTGLVALVIIVYRTVCARHITCLHYAVVR